MEVGNLSEENLLKWCSKHYIAIEKAAEGVWKVPGAGTFLLIESKDGILIDKNMCFIFDETDWNRYDEFKPDYMLFEFGGMWYHCKPKETTNEFNEYVVECNFDDFKYAGKAQLNVEMDGFVHLGIHSEYELLNGSAATQYWAKKAKFLGLNAIALCDKNTMAATMAFQLDCAKYEVKSIMGLTASISINHDYEKEVQLSYDIKLYAKNVRGWYNLLNVNRAINVDCNGYCPEEILFESCEGLVAVIPKEGEFNFLLNDEDKARAWIKKYRKHFKDLYYQIDTVEFFDDVNDLKNLNNIKLYLENWRDTIKPVLINDSYYLDQDMFMLKEYLNKVGSRAEIYSEDQHFKTLEESYLKLEEMFSGREEYFLELFQEMVASTVEISELCNFQIEVGKPRLPKYEYLKKGQTSDDKMQELVLKGFEERVVPKNVPNIDKYIERLEKELSVIIPAAISDYFLILWDIIHWCYKNGVAVGVARGSAGGSLVLYCMGIINIDPMEHNLLFERFLNETRITPLEFVDVTQDGKKHTYKAEELDEAAIDQLEAEGALIERRKELKKDSLPDIDVDFESEYRDVVKEYIKERFGYDFTCSVGTYTKLQLKSAVSDFGKVRGLDFVYMKMLTKKIGRQIRYVWQDLIKYACKSKELYDFVQKYPELVHIMKYGMHQPKAGSVHASAVLVLPKFDGEEPMNVFKWLPVKKVEGMLVSEWEGVYTDRAGFVKEDILGLEQLDKFKVMVRIIKEKRKKDIDLEQIPLEDRKTYKLFHGGFNEDIFQFNGTGLKQFSRMVKPDSIDELTAMNALYRPATMSVEMHKEFALLKHGKKKVSYDFQMEEVTKNNYGIMIYQEDMMKALVNMADFSLLESDNFRTATKKFDKKTMETYRDKFLSGCIAKMERTGYKCKHSYEEEAEVLWKKILSFGGYGFNRSHAAAYALIAYWSQWFKANFPLEFWTVALQFASEDEITYRISEMNKLKQGLTLMPPSVNYSNVSFNCDIKTNYIYWSIVKIKGIGESTAPKILEDRDKNGPFKSYEDFCGRIPKKLVNKSSMTNLILAGAFDDAENLSRPSERRALLLKHFKRTESDVPDIYNAPESKLDFFWIFLQKSLTGYGTVDYFQLLKNQGLKDMAELYVTNDRFFNKSRDYDEVCICGVLNFFMERTTKTNKKYATLEIISNDDVISMMMWEETYLKYIEEMEGMRNKLIAVTGKVKFDTYKSQKVLYSYDDSIVKKLA